jgi:hypothetical protein
LAEVCEDSGTNRFFAAKGAKIEGVARYYDEIIECLKIPDVKE